ncbi:DNA topoisomerase (ATP-hydrolyzing) subunit B [candidate division BRC1 bacterium HGW-BRC1-1]|jgi:DNA gyrase subunit B|nr:MAG: DNA topoisomerase (ATP-hydrolyzing) subunit B [candidate division BRC1 bacterium HGW-BRC1-1]
MSQIDEKQTKQGEYGVSNIRVLQGLEGVRMRPAMYIGSQGPQGLHHLVYEVVDNSIDEALAGYARNVDVTIHLDNSVTVTDDGRGIPVDPHPSVPGKRTVEVVLTMLHAGGKFENDAYKFSGGLHGVGVSVVNALSEWLEIEVKRGGKVYRQRFERGIAVSELEEIGTSRKTGTSVRFLADTKIFETIECNYDTLASRLREMAFLNRGVSVTIRDERGDGRSHKFCYAGGIEEFVTSLNSGKNVINPQPVYFQKARQITKAAMDGGEVIEDVEVEVCIQYNDSYAENVYSFVNNINTLEGGTHMTGFRKALTSTINKYAEKNDLKKKLKENISGDDLKEGLTAVLSLKISDPQFESQTKIKLGNTEVAGIVETIVNDGLEEFLEENPKIARKILEKCVAAALGRVEARKAREIVRKGALEIGSLPGKLADCSEKEPDRCELYIVEGDSAGGSAKQGRDRHYQAILPLRGKILNVERARIDKILSNNEIRNMITALGTGIRESFDIGKLRYGKTIIMTDADVDGAHIRTLLLTFFFRQMQPLIREGKVFIAQPPLYKIKKGRMERYMQKDEDKDRFLLEQGVEDTTVTPREGFGKTDPIRRAELRQLLDSIMAMQALDRSLQRKGTSLRECLLERAKTGTKQFPIGIFTEEEVRHFAYTEKEYSEFESEEEEMEEAEQNLSSAAPVLKKEEQQVLSLDADVEVEQDAEEPARRRYESQSLRAEAGQMVEFLRRLEKLGVDPILYQIDPADSYRLINDEAPFVVSTEKQTFYAHSLVDMLEMVLDIGKKGITVQRYKGLGEMNAQQLWETTMNPQTRTLIRVTLDMAGDYEAENVFTTLMGDDVDKRRKFIQKHAPEVRNLDI